jgi:hypothetical protein
MKSINESLDDLPTTSIIKKMHRMGNEIYLFDKQQPSTIIGDIDNFDNGIDRTIPIQQISKIRKMAIAHTGQDCDNLEQRFEGHDWQLDSEKWQPPISHANISKLKQQSQAPAQSDSGANRIVTDDLSLLTSVTMIDPYPMGGCNKNDPTAIICTAIGGTLQLSSMDGTRISVTDYYSNQVDGTIISPTTNSTTQGMICGKATTCECSI